MKVTVVSRNGREVIKGGIEIPDSAIVSDLQDAIHKRTKKFYPSRQRLTLPVAPGSKEKPVVLHYKKSLKEYTDGNSSELTVVFKDLGPQVSYRTLFFFEYLGPLIIYPLFYYLPVYQFFGYKGERIIWPVQTYALYYWCFHYFKRIMETFFVHRFSHATSPLSNVFRNCFYYWTFGAYIAYYVNHPLYTPVNDLQMKIGFGLGVVCQLANFYTHILLKNLRDPSGNGGYQIPRGFLFNIVTCANYMTEIYQWLGFNFATETVAGYIFLIVAASIMTNWALAKHRRLKKLHRYLHFKFTFHCMKIIINLVSCTLLINADLRSLQIPILFSAYCLSSLMGRTEEQNTLADGLSYPHSSNQRNLMSLPLKIGCLPYPSFSPHRVHATNKMLVLSLTNLSRRDMLVFPVDSLASGISKRMSRPFNFQLLMLLWIHTLLKR